MRRENDNERREVGKGMKEGEERDGTGVVERGDKWKLRERVEV